MSAPCNPRPECLGCPYNSGAAPQSVTAFDGALTVDLHQRVARGPAASVDLSAGQVAILGALAHSAGHPVGRDHIALAMDGLRRGKKSEGYSDRTIDVLMVRLRHALAQAAPTLEIVSVWGFGYKLQRRTAGAA